MPVATGIRSSSENAETLNAVNSSDFGFGRRKKRTAQDLSEGDWARCIRWAATLAHAQVSSLHQQPHQEKIV